MTCRRCGLHPAVDWRTALLCSSTVARGIGPVCIKKVSAK